MTTTTMYTETGRTEAVVARDTGLMGRVIVSWTVAGGLLAGGYLVAAMTLSGRLSGNALLMTAGALYVLGAALGFAHGVVLGFLGRPADVTPKQALGRIGMAALYAIPAVTVGFLAAGWIAMSAVAAYLGRVLPLVGAGLGWVAGGVVVAMAVFHGFRALRNAYTRWPDRRLGTVLVAGTFAALLVLFMADRPELWGTRLRVTETGAVLLAAVGAFWIAGPVVTAGLALLRRLREQAAAGFAPNVGSGFAAGFMADFASGVAPATDPDSTAGIDRAPRALASIAIGLTAGAVLGVLAVPFQQAAFTTTTLGPVGGVVQVLSRALVDEVLLRLFVVTGVVWMLVRWYATPGPRAAVVAVVAAAVAQAVLYLPGIAAIGFPTFTMAAGYLAVTVMLPALVFGALYWKRGFATAVLAHATALLAVMLMM